MLSKDSASATFRRILRMIFRILAGAVFGKPSLRFEFLVWLGGIGQSSLTILWSHWLDYACVLFVMSARSHRHRCPEPLTSMRISPQADSNDQRMFIYRIFNFARFPIRWTETFHDIIPLVPEDSVVASWISLEPRRLQWNTFLE